MHEKSIAHAHGLEQSRHNGADKGGDCCNRNKCDMSPVDSPRGVLKCHMGTVDTLRVPSLPLDVKLPS